MVEIDTFEDIRIAKEEKRISQGLAKELEGYFKELVKSITGEAIWNEYSLEENGAIFVLENTDNIQELEDIGLLKEDRGIFGTSPEFANTIEVEGVNYYKLVIVCNNSSAIVIYIEALTFGQEFEEWIKDYLMD